MVGARNIKYNPGARLGSLRPGRRLHFHLTLNATKIDSCQVSRVSSCSCEFYLARNSALNIRYCGALVFTAA